MISVTRSTERRPFCAVVESIIISVWLTACLVEFCPYTQTESYLITWSFREGALKRHRERSNCLGARRILLGRCGTWFAKLRWEILQWETLLWLEQAAQRTPKTCTCHTDLWVYCRVVCGENAVGFVPLGLQGTSCSGVLWLCWADLQRGW